MDRQILTFRELIAPVEPERFFAEYYRKKPLYIPGPPEKFAAAYSWDVLNDLLEMTILWNEQTLELTQGGKGLLAEHYCYQGTDRDNKASDNVDYRRMYEYLRQGATLTLNFVERLTPELRALSQTLAAVLCAPVNCSSFCSWPMRPGYAPHFDSTQVFVCHVEGTKRWRVYEGRMPAAAQISMGKPGDYPADFHDRAKGQVMETPVLTPGDVLYLPSGQYHEAMADSEPSLHLSFAVRHMVVQDFINLLAIDLPKDEFFRQFLPALDEAADDAEFRRGIAGRLDEIMANPQVGEGLQQFLHGKAFERFADFALPGREQPAQYRVRWRGKTLARHGDKWRLTGNEAPVDLDEVEGMIAEWAIEKDYFSDAWFDEDFEDFDGEIRSAVLAKLKDIGLIDPL